MNDKELRKLSRQELLELLIEQTKRADELQDKINQLEAQLNQRDLIINNAGSLAEAALKINKVFEAADKAVEQYLDSIKKLGAEAYIERVPKASSDEMLDSLLGEFRKRAEAKSAPPVLISDRPSEESIKPKADKPKVREIKHLKN